MQIQKGKKVIHRLDKRLRETNSNELKGKNNGEERKERVIGGATTSKKGR